MTRPCLLAFLLCAAPVAAHAFLAESPAEAGFAREGCKVGAAAHADFAVKVGEVVQMMYHNTNPNSRQRVQDMQALAEYVDGYQNRQLEERKKTEDAARARKMDPALVGIYLQKLRATIDIAQLVAHRNPGRTRVFYRRAIEERCNLP